MKNSKRKDRTGIRYGRLIVVKLATYSFSINKNMLYWWCKCDCNSNFYTLVSAYCLVAGDIKSCGCLFYETVKINNKKLQDWKRNIPLLTKKEKLEKARTYYKLNKEHILNRKKRTESSPQRLAKKREYEKNRFKNDMEFKLRKRLRTRLRKYIKRDSIKGSHIKDLGCSILELKYYLEKLFKPGMNWNNWGNGRLKWSIDHIKPLSHFKLTNRTEFLEAVNFKNLKPEWNIINFRKGNRYVG